MTYASQHEIGGYYCCKVVALLNAARYHNKKTIDIAGPAWQDLVDFAGCRQSDVIDWWPLASRFGINPLPVSLEIDQIQCNLPVMIFLQTPYNVDHTALIVDVREDRVAVANYKGHLSEEIVSWRAWDKLRFVGTLGYSLQM